MSRRALLPKAISRDPVIVPVSRQSSAIELGQALAGSIAEAIGTVAAKPIYLQINTGYCGKIEIKQIEFLSIGDFAQLAKVEPRTVLSWMQRGIAPPAYRPPGSRFLLFEISEVLEWIKNNPVVLTDSATRIVR